MSGPDDAPTSVAGRRIGRWTLLSLLGEGGMGRVYVARDDVLGREVALKQVTAGDARTRARFLREMTAAARVQHPALVRIHEVGQEGGQPFLVMERVAGQNLADVVKARGRLPQEEAARLVAEVARGVAALHAAGVVHRDLKPANVVLDGAGAPRLIDFGLAWVEDAGRLTLTHEVMGTPMYLAPEQADGRQCGPGVDVYGLGGVLFELLTGDPPGLGCTSLAELIGVKLDPKAPSTRVPGIAPGLDALCLRLLDPRPERRPTAAELAEALDALARGAPASPPPLGRRATWLLAAGALASVTLAAAAIVGARPRASQPSLETSLAAWEGEALERTALRGLALPPPLEAALHDPAAPAALASRVWAWEGLRRVTAGELGAAAEAAARATAEGTACAPASLLRAALALPHDPAGARRELDFAERAGLAPDELRAWRVRAWAASAFASSDDAEAALRAASASARGDEAGTSDDLAARALLSLGRRGEGEARAARVAAPSVALRRALALVAVERDLAEGALARAASRVEGLPAPLAPEPRATAPLTRALAVVAPALHRAVSTLSRLQPDDQAQLEAALRLVAAFAPGLPTPDGLRVDLRAQLLGGALTGASESVALAELTAAAWPDDPDLLFAVASCAPHANDEPEVARRLIPLVRRATSVCGSPERELARVFLARTLLAADDVAAARDEARAANAAIDGGAGAPWSLTLDEVEAAGVQAVLIEAIAERRLERPERALALLDGAGEEHFGDEVRLERFRALLALGRLEEAFAVTRALTAGSTFLSTWHRRLAGEAYTATVRAERFDLARLLADDLARVEEGSEWVLRAAWLRARTGDWAGARSVLEPRAAEVDRTHPGLLDRLRAGEVMPLDALEPRGRR